MNLTTFALLGSLSVGEALGGVVLLLISTCAVFFWGSGLGWHDKKRDRRNGL